MAVFPPSFETVKCSADAEGWIFKENWNTVGVPPDKTRWNVCPTWWWGGDESINGAPATFDTAMGENGVRFTSGRVFPRPFFDHTKPAKWEYRISCQDPGTWAALGVLYSGEGSYCGGVTSERIEWDALGSQGDPPLGLQVGNYGGAFVGGLPDNNGSSYAPFGAVFDVQTEWYPGTSYTRYTRSRVALVTNGVRGAWSDWLVANNFNGGGMGPVANPHQQAMLIFPASLYFVATDWSLGHFYSSQSVWGASDFFGWDTWRKSSTAAVAEGPDISQILGGLCSRPSAMANSTSNYIPLIQQAPWIGDGSPQACIDRRIADIGYPVTQDFEAQSPAVVPESGYRYRTLKFRAYHANDGIVGPPRFPEGNLRIYVRDASTGELLPDSMVPGNSIGLCSVAPTMPVSSRTDGGNIYNNYGRDDTFWNYNTDYIRPARTMLDYGWNDYMEYPGTQVVSLAGIPPDRHIFLDVQGHCDAGMPCRMDAKEPLPWENTPRLGGVWIDFEEVRLTSGIKNRNRLITTLGGYRRPGSVVTVT